MIDNDEIDRANKPLMVTTGNGVGRAAMTEREHVEHELTVEVATKNLRAMCYTKASERLWGARLKPDDAAPTMVEQIREAEMLFQWLNGGTVPNAPANVVNIRDMN